jgi:two-component system, OmpR family, KDP operon response regulator KdpE
MDPANSGVYVAGANSVELALVSSWAARHCGGVQRLSQESAVELEVPSEASLVVIDAQGDALDAVVQVARIRTAHASVPIVLLGPLSEEYDTFSKAAVRSGANAVLKRPVDRHALFEALRRLSVPTRKSAPLRGCIALSASCILDLEGRCLRVGRVERPLTKAKFDLLAYLVQHSGRAVSAEELVRAGIFSPSQRARCRAIMLELREKLGEAKSVIRTVPGYGYRFDPFVAEAPGDKSDRRDLGGAPEERSRTGG